MKLHPRKLEQRVAAARSPLLAKHIPAGCTGKIADLVGYRAFAVLFDGSPAAVVCLPEDLARIPSGSPSVLAPPRIKLRKRAS